MKHIYSLFALALTLGFAACNSEDESMLTAESTTPSVQPQWTPIQFPEDDGSKKLTGKPRAQLDKLIKAMDPQRALSRTMLNLNDDQYNEIKAFTDGLCATCTDNTSKITTLNRWVKQNVTYSESDNNAYSVFKYHKGVCQGYANLLHAMLLTQNIPCVGINGYMVTYPTAPIEFNPGHAWVYAYGNSSWYVCDPTNSESKYVIGSSSCDNLQPDMVDAILFEDDNFMYNFYNMNFNVCRVKHADNDLVLPYSAGGYVVSSFNPQTPIPTSVQNIYIGKNITTLGKTYTIIGLIAYHSFDEMCYVDPENPSMGSYNGVVYNKDEKGNLTDIYYIPSMMKTIILRPMETVEKNTIIDLEGVEEIVFTEGTKKLEAYAIESCPRLRTVYIPEGCVLDDNAIYRCPTNVQVIVGVPEAIHHVRL